MDIPRSWNGPLSPRAFFARTALEVAPELLGCVIEHETPEGLVAVLLTEVEAYEGSGDPASHAYRGRSARNAVMFGPPGHAYVYFTYGMHFCVNMVCLREGTASAVLLRAGRVVAGIPLAARRRSVAPGRSRPVDGAEELPPGLGEQSVPERSLGERSLGERSLGERSVRQRDLARGPARLCQALGIDRAMDGTDVCDPRSPVRVRTVAEPGRDGPPWSRVTTGPQIDNDPPRGPDRRGAPGPPTGGAPHISTGPRVGVSSAARRPWRFWLTGDPTVSAYRAHVPRAGPKVVSPPDHEDGTMHQ